MLATGADVEEGAVMDEVDRQYLPYFIVAMVLIVAVATLVLAQT